MAEGDGAREERQSELYQPGGQRFSFLLLFSLSCKNELAYMLKFLSSSLPFLYLLLHRSVQKIRFIANKNENNVALTSFQENKKE